MPDHFYTTHPRCENSTGYLPEGITGHVFDSQQPDTVAVYRFWNSTSRDHFYTTDANGEVAKQNGYVAEGIKWWMYSSQKPGTTALYRWWGLNDHFYCTDPHGEVAPQVGYQAEGILGYLLTSPQPNAVALNRWFDSPRYELEGTTLKAWCYSPESGEVRVSALSLDKCIAIAGGFSWSLEAEVPDPQKLHWSTLSQNVTKPIRAAKYSMTQDGVLRANFLASRHERIDRDIDLKPYLRKTFNGHIEFVHPVPETEGIDWINKIGDICKQIQDAKQDPMERGIDAAFQLFDNWVGKTDSLEFDMKEWLKGSYPENGRVVRRGS